MNTNIIDWSKNSWNPVSGCSKISTGCKNCYAKKIALKLQKSGEPKYKNGFKVTLHPQLLREPLKWKESKRVFVNSMSDLFHDAVPNVFYQEMLFYNAYSRSTSILYINKKIRKIIQNEK